MKRIFYSWGATALLALSFSFVVAQSKDTEKYRNESEEMRKSVWAWEKPEFKQRDIPKEYANASKIIIAHHTELSADSKTKLAFYGITFGTKKEQTISEVVRELIKINDKSAVSEYSELSFRQFKKGSGFYKVDKTTSYVGVRVIKPDGSIEEINADDIILTKDEVKEKDAKLAIPGLQPGDILDYFISTEQQLTDDIIAKPYKVTYFGDAPILNLSFHAQLGKKYAIDYRSFNNAPDLSVTKNEDGEIIVNAQKNNIPPFETSLWISPGQLLPFSAMFITLGVRRTTNTWGEREFGEIRKITDGMGPFKGKRNDFNSFLNNNYWPRSSRRQFDDIVDDAENKAKKLGLKYQDLSNEDKAALLYYTFRFIKLLNFNIDDMAKIIDIGSYHFNSNAVILYCLLKDGGIDGGILLSSTRDGLRMNDAIDEKDINAVAFMADSNKIMALESIYDIPFVVPEDIEGVSDTKAYSFHNAEAKRNNYPEPEISNGPTVPVSAADKNAHIENLKLSLNADKAGISVNRSTTLKGCYKEDEQRKLILYEDYYEEERKAFNEEKSLIETLEDGKKSKKDVDEVKNAFTEARKKQKDAFLKEAKSWFDLEISDFKDYKTDNLGVRHTAPDFVYSSSFNLSEMVKKTGNNIIVEIGKIEGKPFAVTAEQRKRDIDIYMPFARSLEYNIELAIPEGYTAEGIAALNKKVENETGYFTVDASSTDKLITIKLKKYYLHNFEPASNWDKLLSFIDAANDWGNTKILLKKK